MLLLDANSPARGQLPELVAIEQLRVKMGSRGTYRELASIYHKGVYYPVSCFCFGPDDVVTPALVVVGGVHGLERIGSHVAITALQSLLAHLQWDEVLQRALRSIRLYFVPLLNPVGTLLGKRSNARGVDLMRNAPDHPEGWATPLVGGQRFSRLLPWYRGDALKPMEQESAALCGLFEQELLSSELVLSLDVHSGFGFHDRLWFPYARTYEPIEHLPELYAFKNQLDSCHPAHVYIVESQSKNYTAQGDLWDYLYDQYRQENPHGVFLPLTLEMGSWRWLKKNPRQLFRRLGGFNPLVPHRFRRILRRHLLLIQLMRRLTSSRAWLPGEESLRSRLRAEAMAHWY